jgi:hypothetical protein
LTLLPIVPESFPSPETHPDLGTSPALELPFLHHYGEPRSESNPSHLKSKTPSLVCSAPIWGRGEQRQESTYS